MTDATTRDAHGFGEYGIVANVCEPDRVFRMGALAWLVGGSGGAAPEQYQFLALTRGGKRVVKWAATVRFTNFRAKWIPPYVRAVHKSPRYTGTLAEMAEWAADLRRVHAELAVRHPNRRGPCVG